MKITTFKTLTLVGACIFAANSYGQTKPATNIKHFGKEITTVTKCATVEYEASLLKKNPKRPGLQQFEQWLAPKTAAVKARRLQKNNPPDNNNVVTIPVVVHVLHNGDAVGTDENIADAQILSQITVLNQDFRKMMGTNGFNTNPVGADMEIEFCLAQQDEAGILTTGIVRYNIGSDEAWEMEELEIVKTQTQWNPEKYLNIWVANQITIGGFFELKGYAQFPTLSGVEGIDDIGEATAANTDGVALMANCVGSIEIYPQGNYDATRNLGRTASHEVGHFFGLRHIWGDGNNCDATDYCDDTPYAQTANQGCPIGLDSCPQPGNDMIENYMDYTFDSCLNIFTADQKDRMVAVLQNSPRRSTLTTSTGCVPGVVYDNDGSLNIETVNATCGTTFAPSVQLGNPGNNTITAAVISYQIDDATPASYNWTGSLSNGNQTTIQLPELTTTEGDHTFSVELTSINGIADQAPLNDQKESDFTIAESFNTTQITITIVTDGFGEETIWALLDSEGEPIFSNINLDDPQNSDFYESNQEYTTTLDVESGQCYSFAMVDTAGDGICCDYGNGSYLVTTNSGTVIAQGGEFTDYIEHPFAISSNLNTATTIANNFKLYPNPSNSVLNITTGNKGITPQSYIIYNNIGQVIGSDKVNSTSFSLDISGYSNGIYFMKLEFNGTSQTLKFIKN